MAKVPLPTPTDNQVPSTDIRDAVYAGAMLDKVVTSTELKYIDRLGGEHYTVDGIKAEGDKVVEETRQNLIPLSRQYMTLAAAQADIANIPDGSTTYYRSPDDSSLAIEVINNAGTLEPTGRKMPSQQAVDDIAEQTQQATDGLQRIYLAQQLLSCAMNDLDTTDQIISETLQRLVVSQQVIAEGVNELSQLPDTAEDIQLHTLYAISVLGSQLMPLDGIDPSAKGDQSGQLATLMAFSVLGGAIAPLDGFNPSASGGGSGDAGSPLRYPGIYAFGEPRGLVRIDLTSPSGAPTSKDDAIKGSVRIDIDGEVFSAYCLLSVQGATSAAYPKKNMSIELYPDATYAKTVSLKIGDVLPHEEWVFKANWIDSTHVRNTLCYNLWDKVVETRRSWPKREIDNTYIGKTGAAAVDTGATGHPKGYACITYLNGDFYGIGDLMIGKKRKNYNIAKNEATQILIGFDGAVNIPALPDDGTWELKAPSKSHDETTAALNAWRAFASSSQADFAANASAHLDATNIIDFYVFMCVICAPDCVQKNTQFLTWDGVKWYFMPYDLDTVFGLRWDGKEISYAPTLNLFDNGLVMGANRTFWNKVRTTWLTEMNARYAELRTAGVFSVDTVYTLARDLMSRYSEEMFAAEYAKWPTVPSLNVTSLDQILTWLDARLNYLDTFFSYNP